MKPDKNADPALAPDFTRREFLAGSARRPPQRIEEIDTMKPVLVYEVPRKA